MAKRFLAVIGIVVVASLTVFSGTALAAPPLSDTPSKIDFGTQAVGGFAQRFVTIIHNQDGVLFPNGTYQLSGDVGPFAVVPGASTCDVQGEGGIYSGPTVVLGPPAIQFSQSCTFEVDYIGTALPGKHGATLNATFGDKKISVPISVTVVAAP